MKTDLKRLQAAMSRGDVPAIAKELFPQSIAGGLEQAGDIANLYREAAKEQFVEEGTLEIDDGAVVSISSDGGAYVAAWVWVGNGDVDGLCRECGGLANDGEGYDGLCGNCADRSEGDQREDDPARTSAHGRPGWTGGMES